VLFQWNSADTSLTAERAPLPASASTRGTGSHINAVHLDQQGNLLIERANTWTTYDVSRLTGAIRWQLGGTASSFTLRAASGQVLDSAGKIFAWQDDPESLGNGLYTCRQRVDGKLAAARQPGGLRQAELRPRPPSLVASDNQPEGLAAASQGTRRPRPTATCSPAGDPAYISSSVRSACCCSTRGSRRA